MNRNLQLVFGIVLLVTLGGPSLAQEQADLPPAINGNPGINLGNGGSAPCPPLEKFQPTRPDPPGQATRVEIGMILASVDEINDVEQSITADIYQIMRWRDPRLAEPARGDAQAVCTLPEGRAWRPLLQIEGIRSLDKPYADIVLINAQGDVTLIERLYLTAAARLDLRDFPFDKHVVKVHLASISASVEELELVPFSGMSGKLDRVSISGWDLGEVTGEVSVEHAPRLNMDMPWFHLVIPVKREWGFYIWKTIFPLTAIVFMSWAVFWITPDSIPPRTSLAATSMLSMIAYLFALTTMLPRISYLTRADRFTVGAAILIFIALVEVITTTSFAKSGRVELGDIVNHWSRIVFPIAFVVIFVFSFVI